MSEKERQKEVLEQEVKEQDTAMEEEDSAAEQTMQAESVAEEELETEEAAETESDDDIVTDEEGADKREGRKAKKKAKAEKKDAKDAKNAKNAMEEKVAELEDKVMRQMAEFENFRKRTEKEKAKSFGDGAKSVVEKILPVVDNFERGLAAIPEEEKGTPFAEGMAMVYKQLMTELEKMEVKPIEALGKEFDPTLHNAVMQVESEEYGSGIIAQELQKGYMYRDTVVRHSMVAVVP